MIGKFITFEGGEGSGKTTQSKLLHQYLLSQNINTIWTREIGGTPESERIRDLIMQENLTDFAELLMIFAARFQHVTNVILPALKSGKYVICDRFIDSSLAYSSIMTEHVLSLHNSIFGNLMPDITFFIDIDPEIGLKRAISRGDANKFEMKDLSFHKKVQSNYKILNTKFPNRIIAINGNDDVHAIHHKIVDLFFDRLDITPRKV